ncbi:oxygenase MpaB family protein [Gordonia sp. ABSL1-1]|uniref:oxygenase MpaB family protein n=1 Tax=Gordonia sp. ABSL1-1 TaxID=3053923 RepID=UPI002572E1D9|nr:oxygenase MpaB family protein [Gordonia sp. ABSL1-1]MDL9936309.1 oxygenase MpaB family protein [Gordonia sp. ABSL1-1]
MTSVVRVSADEIDTGQVIPEESADPAARGKRKSYLPDLTTAVPVLTTGQTRLTVATPERRPNEAYVRTEIEDAYDFWAAAGSAANVAMQLGWPEVAYGVMESKVDSGALMKHPWKRLRTTEQYLAVAIMGTDEERAAYREAINTAHRHVRSTESSPVKYNAFNRELQMWVAACLFVGFEDTHQLLHGRMNPEQAEQFYRSATPLATTLQVTEDMWPATRVEFDKYWNVACERITYDETQKKFINDLVDLRMITPLLAYPLRGLLRFLTIGSLPPLFREKLELRWRPIDQRRYDNLFLFVGFVNRFLPRPLRFGGFYLIMRDLRRRIRKDQALI